MDYSDLTGNELDNIDTGESDWGQATYEDTPAPNLDFNEFGDFTDYNYGTNFDVDNVLGNWRDSTNMTTGVPDFSAGTGFLGGGLGTIGSIKSPDSSGFAGISSPTDTRAQTGVQSANVAGWGDVVDTNAKYENRYGAFGGTPQADINNRTVMGRYEADPVTQGTGILGSIAKYAGMINPALGGMLGLGATAANQINRASYGLPNDYSNWGGLAGGLLGGGGIGSAIGSTIGKMGVQGLQGNYNAMGDTALNSALRTGGGFLGGQLFGGVGAQIGSDLAGRLPGLLATGAQIYSQNRAANRMNELARQAEGDSRFYSDSVRNLVQNPDSFKNTDVYRSAYNTAMNEGRRTMAQQGMLGSGGRVAGLAGLSNEVANRNYQGYLQNLQMLAAQNNPAAANQLAMLAEAAKGRRNTMIMQQLFGGDMV